MARGWAGRVVGVQDVCPVASIMGLTTVFVTNSHPSDLAGLLPRTSHTYFQAPGQRPCAFALLPALVPCAGTNATISCHI